MIKKQWPTNTQAKYKPNMVAQPRLRVRTDQRNRTKTATKQNKTNMVTMAITALMCSTANRRSHGLNTGRATCILHEFEDVDASTNVAAALLTLSGSSNGRNAG